MGGGGGGGVGGVGGGGVGGVGGGGLGEQRMQVQLGFFLLSFSVIPAHFLCV